MNQVRARARRNAIAKAEDQSQAMIWLLRILAVFAAMAIVLQATGAFAKAAPESFSGLAKKLLPTVVNISTTQTVEGRGGLDIPQLPPGSPFEDFFKDFFERNQPQQRSRKATSLGSGFIVDPKGYVVTNNHVIDGADEISVILHDDTRLKAELVGRDPKTDIAVLKVEFDGDLPIAEIGNSDEIEVGDWVIAIGNPFGLGGTVTAGIISARGRDINSGPYDDYLQTDASINRGNSGGPMFNMDGEVIGVNTAIFSPTGGSVGIGFAVPTSTASPVIRQLIKNGEVRRGWLGVHIQSVTPEIAESLGLKEAKGAMVASVVEDGPAANSDIKAGDVILEFGGVDVPEMRRLPRIVADVEPDTTVDVTVWRDGGEKSVKVTVGTLKEQPTEVAAVNTKDTGAERSVEGLGLKVAALDQSMRERFQLDEKAKGVVVTEVDATGPAAEKGLQPGDRIIQVSQSDVTEPEDVNRKVDEAKAQGRKSVLLRVESQQGLRFVAIRIDKG
ncbi:MAG: DegQ family serine endoprotease [Rhodospirillales bacterium]|nr:DegQ family serine endoprotease [Rhodospirillales bacterium]MBO6787157.1 DegQ family serine endoprotease [Rhodospirillales bacterium]